ncbi:MAG: hypothetical protein FJ144_11585 [Deltaproteobacteria bacterium]|nr:hypothetical protein [Deltaproteobacteria bacterium]
MRLGSTTLRRGAALVAAALVATLGTLAILEVAARRFAAPFRLPPAPESRTIDPYGENPFIVSFRPLLRTFVPGSRYRAARSSYTVDYTINSSGFRGPEVAPKHARRLLVVGDSIAEGHGVPFEDAFPALLDEQLRGEGWEVVSAAMQGASPIYYAANLPRYLALEPDAVLLVLFENDLWDDRKCEQAYFGMPLLDVESRFALAAALRRLWRSAHPTPFEEDVRSNLARSPGGLPPAPDARFPWVFAPDDVRREWAKSAVYLDRFANALDERGIPLFVSVVAIGTLTPAGRPVHSDHAHALEAEARRWAEQRGLPFLSLMPLVEWGYARFPAYEDVMIADDGHPTSEMHRRFARALARWARPWLTPAAAPRARSGPSSRPRPFRRRSRARRPTRARGAEAPPRTRPPCRSARAACGASPRPAGRSRRRARPRAAPLRRACS